MLEPAVRWIKQNERGVPPQRAPRLLRPMAKMFSGREREGFRLGQAWQTHRATRRAHESDGFRAKVVTQLGEESDGPAADDGRARARSDD